VKDWQWTNPHTWIVLMVMNEKTHQLEEWGLELTDPGHGAARLVTQGAEGRRQDRD